MYSSRWWWQVRRQWGRQKQRSFYSIFRWSSKPSLQPKWIQLDHLSKKFHSPCLTRTNIRAILATPHAPETIKYTGIFVLIVHWLRYAAPMPSWMAGIMSKIRRKIRQKLDPSTASKGFGRKSKCLVISSVLKFPFSLDSAIGFTDLIDWFSAVALFEIELVCF